MSVDKATVSNIARLARIKVDDAELENLANELSNILSWIEKLNEVDTVDLPPFTSVTEQELPRRADTLTDGGDAPNILKNAPVTSAGFFVVPKVIE